MVKRIERLYIAYLINHSIYYIAKVACSCYFALKEANDSSKIGVLVHVNVEIQRTSIFIATAKVVPDRQPL